ncbi:MAG TPA: LamG domain-containing protein [Kofleriaceae bacterium]
MWVLALGVLLAGCGRLEFGGSASDAGNAGPDGTGLDDAGRSVYATAVLADNPVSYWRLNDTGTVAHNEIAGGPDGMFQGNVVYGVAGAVNDDRAVQFDGISTRLEIGDYYAFAGVPYSAEAWVLSEDSNDTRFLFYRYNDDGTIGWQAYFGIGYFLHSREYGGEERDYATSDQTPPRAWVHAVATYDGDRTHMFIDGEAFDGNQNVGTLPAGTGGTLVIGDNSPGQFNKINGRLDEIAIYDHALTQAQIAAHYAASGR